MPPFLTNVEIWWDLPIAARFYNRLAEFARVILIDKRGSGLSDRLSTVETPEERMDDLRAVMDAVDSNKATIFAASESCAIAVIFAATHPDRIAGLILWGGIARYLPAPDYPWSISDELYAGVVELAASQWGTGVMSPFLLASRAGEPAIQDWFGRYERASASPGALATHLLNNTALDVRALLPTVRHRTLVMAPTDDTFVPVANSRYLAQHIAGAKYVEFPGRDHFYFGDNADRVVEEVEEFLTGTRHVVASDRVLATVLATEIVPGAPGRHQLNEQADRDAIDQFRQGARKLLESHRGHEFEASGDTTLATFDGPARAIYCAQALMRSAQQVGLDLRAGLHAGECEQKGGIIAGVALQVASAVKDLGGPGEIAVSSTVRDLVAGSGIAFEERGRFQLPNVPSEWGVLVVADPKRQSSTPPMPPPAPKFEAAVEKVVGGPAARALPPLSKRETEVAVLLADGLTNHQIAQRLFLSDRTVEWHVEQILSKLDCTNRAQVASWVSRRATSGRT
jgi:pimeloyl-ACP methyl ester carboxylesterase/DNA-binding CsgD family transcriptional regulator